MEEEKSICIICGLDKDGLELKDDRVLKAMRWIKRNITKNPKNYRLVVCKEDFLKYKKGRDKYNKRQIIYLTIGIAFLVVLFISSGGRIYAVLVGILIAAFMWLLALVNYMPAVQMPTVTPSETAVPVTSNTTTLSPQKAVTKKTKKSVKKKK
jgi:hypothetical protein